MTLASAAPLPEALLAELSARFGERLSLSEAQRRQHGRSEAHFAERAPDAVLFPQSPEEVLAAVRACIDHETPIIAYGAGTSMEGQTLALAGGVCLDLSQMNRIVR